MQYIVSQKRQNRSDDTNIYSVYYFSYKAHYSETPIFSILTTNTTNN